MICTNLSTEMLQKCEYLLLLICFHQCTNISSTNYQMKRHEQNDCIIDTIYEINLKAILYIFIQIKIKLISL